MCVCGFFFLFFYIYINEIYFCSSLPVAQVEAESPSESPHKSVTDEDGCYRNNTVEINTVGDSASGQLRNSFEGKPSLA